MTSHVLRLLDVCFSWMTYPALDPAHGEDEALGVSQNGPPFLAEDGDLLPLRL